MIGPVARTDAQVARAGASVFRSLPPTLQLAVLVLALLVGVAGCSAAWIDQQSYVPAPNICRAHETTRTDCVQVERPAPLVQQPVVTQ
ncbi:hypothetical protein ABZ413_36620 [Nocardia rhamnosiphila]|uniref:hypothetical protein n=1 Tax=Nocardia rhamnosiphila TaxID=426716 RepID=UPI0033ECDFF2